MGPKTSTSLQFISSLLLKVNPERVFTFELPYKSVQVPSREFKVQTFESKWSGGIPVVREPELVSFFRRKWFRCAVL